MVKKGWSASGVLLIIVGLVWILSEIDILPIESLYWTFKYWPALLVVSGLYLAFYGRAAKSFSLLLVIIALFIATLHHSRQFYDTDWDDYEYEQDWELFL